jgi:hypothetical protein
MPRRFGLDPIRDIQVLCPMNRGEWCAFAQHRTAGGIIRPASARSKDSVGLGLHALLTQHYPMLQRNLLYTGITRGKRLVVLVAQKKAVAIAARNVSGPRRWSKLREMACGQRGCSELCLYHRSAPPQAGSTLTEMKALHDRHRRRLLDPRAADSRYFCRFERAALTIERAGFIRRLGIVWVSLAASKCLCRATR